MSTELHKKSESGLQDRLADEKKHLAAVQKQARRTVSASGQRELELQRLVHELQVHQIELEMQNRELREARAALELSRDLYADLYDSAPVGYLDLDDHGILRNINMTGADILGEVRSVIVGKPFALYLEGASRQRFRNGLRLCKETRERQVLQLQLHRKGRQILPVELSMIRTGESLCRAILTDITERQRSEDEKAELLGQTQRAREEAETDRDFIQQVLTHAPLMVGLFEGPKHRLKWLNQTALKETHISKNSFGLPLAKVLPAVHDQISGLLDHVYSASDPVTTGEITFQFVDRPPRWFHIALAPVPQPGKAATGVIFMAADITERKQAFEALRQSEEVLESRVKARTTELADALKSVQTEVAERKQSEDARQELFRQLSSFQENERRHIARELHDQMGQHLTAMSIGLKTLETLLRGGSPLSRAAWESSGETGPQGARQQLRDLQKLADEIGIEIHRVASELRPTALDDLGLQATLSNYLEEWSARFGVAVDFHPESAGKERLPSEIETTVYRIVQEALTNVLKHAEASSVSLILSRNEGHLVTVIEDNGKGFNPDRVPVNGTERPRLGLAGIKERVMLAGGSFQIESKPGCGTTLFVRLPLPGTASPEAPPRNPLPGTSSAESPRNGKSESRKSTNRPTIVFHEK